jgi:hypothetical protein
MAIDLPDLDYMMSLVKDIYSANLEKGELELKIKVIEATITKEATTNEKYFVNGRSPSQAYIDSSYKILGFDGELVPLRKKLAELDAHIFRLRGELELNKTIIDIWRTQAANERTSFG